MHLRFYQTVFFMHDYSYSFVEDLILGPKAFFLPLEFWNNYFSSLCIGNCFFLFFFSPAVNIFPTLPTIFKFVWTLCSSFHFCFKQDPFSTHLFSPFFFNIFCCYSGCLLISLSYTSVLPVYCTHWPFLLYKYIRPQSHLSYLFTLLHQLPTAFITEIWRFLYLITPPPQIIQCML